MRRYGYVYQTCEGLYDKYISQMKEADCLVFLEKSEEGGNRPEWARMIQAITAGDEIYIVSLSNCFNRLDKIFYFFGLITINNVRLVSLMDKLDTASIHFPSTKITDLLVILSRLPSDIGIRNALVNDKCKKRKKSERSRCLTRKERWSKVCDMYVKNYSIQQIMEETGYTSNATIYQILNRHKVKFCRRFKK